MQQNEYPHLEDVLAGTRTHRQDWLVGAKEINLYLTGSTYGYRVRVVPEMVRVRNVTGGMSPYTWAVRRSDVDRYLHVWRVR